jgi:hypothetical protein
MAAEHVHAPRPAVTRDSAASKVEHRGGTTPAAAGRRVPVPGLAFGSVPVPAGDSPTLRRRPIEAFRRLATERSSGGSGQTDGVVIRRAPIASYGTLAPRALHDRAIPAHADGSWKKPKWLRGANDGAYQVRQDVAARTRSVTPQAAIPFQPVRPQYACALCGQYSDLNGLSVDHVTDWYAYCQSATDLQGLEELFHEETNLHLVHNNCNSSKGASDLFDWWRANAGRNMHLDPGTGRLILGALQRVYEHYGVDWLYEIPATVRARVVDGIIRQAIPNVNEHLMGNAKIMDAMGGWPKA